MRNDTLTHHGIIGQKWGVRRYQNPDGTLTAAGKKRYLNGDGNLNSEGQKKYTRLSDDKVAANKLLKRNVNSLSNDELTELNKRQTLEATYKKNNQKKSLIDNVAGITKVLTTATAFIVAGKKLKGTIFGDSKVADAAKKAADAAEDTAKKIFDETVKTASSEAAKKATETATKKIFDETVKTASNDAAKKVYEKAFESASRSAVNTVMKSMWDEPVINTIPELLPGVDIAGLLPG